MYSDVMLLPGKRLAYIEQLIGVLCCQELWDVSEGEMRE